MCYNADTVCLNICYVNKLCMYMYHQLTPHRIRENCIWLIHRYLSVRTNVTFYGHGTYLVVRSSPPSCKKMTATKIILLNWLGDTIQHMLLQINSIPRFNTCIVTHSILQGARGIKINHIVPHTCSHEPAKFRCHPPPPCTWFSRLYLNGNSV